MVMSCAGIDVMAVYSRSRLARRTMLVHSGYRAVLVDLFMATFLCDMTRIDRPWGSDKPEEKTMEVKKVGMC